LLRAARIRVCRIVGFHGDALVFKLWTLINVSNNHARTLLVESLARAHVRP
jgi:hypothetical protein